MMTLNSGLMFCRKYESDGNAVRRFLLANVGLTKQRCDRLRKASDPDLKFLGFVQQMQSTEYWLTNRWLFSDSWGSYQGFGRYGAALSPAVNKCPLCAAEVFDSHCFRYQWMERCPLHGVPLKDLCPDCGQPWPDYRYFVRHECPTCGTTRPRGLDERRRQIRGHTKAQIELLDLCWLLPRTDQLFCKVLYHDYINHGWDRGILTGSWEFPELAMSLLPESRAFFERVGSPASRFEECQFDGTVLATADLKEMSVDRPCPRGFIRQAVNEVDTQIRAVLSENLGKVLVPDLPQYVHADFIEDYETTEIVYDAWRSITDALLDPATTLVPSGWWTRMFELQGLPQPEIPPIVNLVVSNDSSTVFDPSDDFRSWMYKRQLTNLFVYLYRHALLLRWQLIIMRNPPSIRAAEKREGGAILCAPQEDKSLRVELGWPRRYSAFRVRLLANGRLQVVFRQDQPWSVLLNSHPPPSGTAMIETSTEAGWRGQEQMDVVLSRYLISSQSLNLLDFLHRIAVSESRISTAREEPDQYPEKHSKLRPCSLSQLANHFGHVS